MFRVETSRHSADRESNSHPGTAQPHALDAWFVADGGQAGAAVAFRIRLLDVVQKHAAFRNHGIAACRLFLAASGRQGEKDDRRIHTPLVRGELL